MTVQNKLTEKKPSAPRPRLFFSQKTEKRIYLVGAEFKDGKAESYYFGDRRVLMLETEPDRPQYNITDRVGNTVVTFEDRDEDGIIVTEAEEMPAFCRSMQI